jgi:mannose-1-phosphate guanylyltransferase
MSNDAQARLSTFWTVIPAGGSGTRLWPLSRPTRPKFLLPLTGDRSLLRQTVDRLTPMAPPHRTLVVCGPAHAAAIARQLPQLPEENVLIEPSPKGSAPAIGLAAVLIARQDPHAILGSFAADHDIADLGAFENAVRAATAAAAAGWLCTVGLTPSRPETGYGYIERSDEVVVANDHGTAFRTERFVEKPNLERATEYLATGCFLWNASMFIWQVSTFLEEMQRLMPELHSGLKHISDAWETPQRDQVVAGVWSGLGESTIDQGIMEKASRVAVVPAEMGWSDVGDWHGLGELIEHDSVGNSVKGDLVQIDSRNCVVWSETGRLVSLIGQDNTVVVDTPDALLVIDRSRAQDVKQIVDELRRRHRSEVR